MLHKLLPLLTLATLILAACGGSPAQPGSAASASTPGQALFATNCGECHSDDGSGTDEAPAVKGHTVEQVLEQVRAPEGDMDAIPTGKLSDADLSLIAQYVTSLGGGEAHPDIMPTDEERAHLEAAYQAIEDHENMDRETAVTHLDQAVALASGESADLYQELIDSIQAKKAGVARHELKELLGMEEGH